MHALRYENGRRAARQILEPDAPPADGIAEFLELTVQRPLLEAAFREVGSAGVGSVKAARKALALIRTSEWQVKNIHMTIRDICEALSTRNSPQRT
jgi:hypothetical protein